MASTRSKRDVVLLGNARKESLSSLKQLPTVKEVLLRLFFFLKNEKQDLSSASALVIEEVIRLWNQSSITTAEKRNAVQKLKVEYEKYRKVMKNHARGGEAQEKKEAEYNKYCLGLFDIAKGNVMSHIEIQEDRDFLRDQRGARVMFLGGSDKKYEARIKAKDKKQKDLERRRWKSKSEIDRLLAKSAVECEQSPATSSEDDHDDDEYAPPKPLRLRSRSPLGNEPQPGPSVNRRRVIDDPLFVASCDRAGVSTRAAMHVVTPALMAAGVNVGELTLSVGSLHEARKEVRTELGKSLQEEFKPEVPLILHFDGKLLPDPEGGRSDRLAIVVTGMGLEKILSVPSIPAGTGVAMGGAILKVLEEWPQVKPWLAGLCFDTTAANTGVHGGACAVVERALGSRLLFLACRHHMAELVMSAVFDHFFSSSGPDIPIFGRFKDFWGRLDQSSYDAYDDSDQKSHQWISDRANEIEQFVLNHMEKAETRDDYLELLNLTLAYLGKKPKMAFRRPGAYHRARWMAKGLYCLKICLFRRQLKEAANFAISKHQEQAIQRLCTFLVSVYVRHWFEAPYAADAPINDLLLVKEIEAYGQLVDADVAGKAMQKVKGHLWYLSEDLVGLALFSKKVSPDEKKEMLENMASVPPTKKDLRRVNLNVKAGPKTADLKLSLFVTQRSQNLFSKLMVDTPRTLEDLEIMPQALAALKVVNDAAERAVKLATDYNVALTKSEEERQFIFRVVQHHRQEYQPTKKSFVNRSDGL